MFDNAKARFLGPKAAGKTAIITFDRHLSLPGIYQAAVTHEGGIPEIPTLDTMVEGASNYIEALKHKATNKVVKKLESHLKDNPGATPESILGALHEEWKDVTNQLDTIVDSEAQFAKNAGLLQGILRTNAALGVTDPMVFFQPRIDRDLCIECRRLHLMPDGITPRVYRLSELSHSYHKKGNDVPSIYSLHPHCRCLMQTILTDYGFDKKGMIDYKTRGYDILDEQRGNNL